MKAINRRNAMTRMLRSRLQWSLPVSLTALLRLHIPRLQPARITLSALCLVAMTSVAAAAAPATATPMGLYVRDGVLMRGGSPYLGIGANYQTLFGKLLRNKDDTSSLDKLAHLSKAGIPFV